MQLFEELTGDDVYSWILVNMSGDKRGILLAESGYDCQVLEAHLSTEDMLSIACGGRHTVIETMEIVEHQGMSKVCALVDADVNAALGDPLPANVFTTDMGDLDADAFFSAEGGARFVGPLLPPGTHSIAEMEAEVDRVISLAFAVGMLRLASVRDGMELSLADFPFGSVVHVKPTQFADLEALAFIAVRRSTSPQVCEVCVARLLREALATPGPERELGLCNGHDLASALRVAVKHLGGPTLPPKTMESLLKAILHRCAMFAKLGFHEKIAKWGQARGIAVWHPECALP